MLLKRKFLMIAFGLSLNFISLFALAEEPSPLCTNAVDIVCSSSYVAQHRSAYNQVRKEISQFANKSAEPRIAQMKKEIPAYKIFKRMSAKAKIKNEEIMKAARKILGEIESVMTSKDDIAKIKSYLYESIDQTSFPTSRKDEMKETIKNVVIGNFGDYIDKIGNDQAGLQKIEDTCGSDGLVDNAFATYIFTKEGDSFRYTRYVLVCPGFIVGLKLIKDKKERFNNVLLVLVHEMSHHIDSFDDSYRPYLECIAKLRSQKLIAEEKAAPYCNTDSSKLVCATTKVLSHQKEIIADEWASRVIALYAAKENMSVPAITKILTANYSGLCGTSDEGTHPNTNYRIGIAMIDNPGIADVLNCDNTQKKKQTCIIDAGLISL